MLHFYIICFINYYVTIQILNSPRTKISRHGLSRVIRKNNQKLALELALPRRSPDTHTDTLYPILCRLSARLIGIQEGDGLINL